MNKKQLIEFLIEDFKLNYPDYTKDEIELLNKKLAFFDEKDLLVLKNAAERQQKVKQNVTH